MGSRGDRLEDLLPERGPARAVPVSGDAEATARAMREHLAGLGDLKARMPAAPWRTQGVLASGKIPAGMLFANIPALPERCPECERIHVRRDGCGSTPRPGLVEVVNTDAPAGEWVVDPERLAAAQTPAVLEHVPCCGALSAVGAECTERPGHGGWHRGVVGETPVEWT